MPKSYTRTGDDGTTGRFGGMRMSKTDALAAAIGTLDETNAAVGLARSLLRGTTLRLHSGQARNLTQNDPPALKLRRASAKKELDGWLREIQDMFFRVGADLSTPFDHPNPLTSRITAEDTKILEKKIDALDDKLPELKRFILPTGTPAASALHLARAAMRRAERDIVHCRDQNMAINESLGPFVNRLSSYLFALARWANWKAGVKEEHPRYR